MRLSHTDMEKGRIDGFRDPSLGIDGIFGFKYKGAILKVIASTGMGWEHVSVSLGHRCPSWEEMCYIKDIFWEKHECAIQYHPADTDYIDNHPYCLHMWRPLECEIPKPELIMV